MLAAPLLHGSWGHLWSNLVPLVIMGVLIMLSGVRQFVAVTVLVWLVSGLGVWLIAPAGTRHRRRVRHRVRLAGVPDRPGHLDPHLAAHPARAGAARLYGSIFWTGIVKVAAADITGVVTVSWQGHLFGAIGGVLAAFLVGQGRRPPPRRRRRPRSRT